MFSSQRLKVRCATTLVGIVCFSLSGFVPAVSAAIPNDSEYAQQWYLNTVGLPEAWNFAKGSPLVTVAILDSGVDLDHPDLKDRIWTNSGEIAGDGLDNDGNGYIDDVYGWDFNDGDNDPNPEVVPEASSEGIQHGTLVAGIIGAAGNNLQGITGVNWNVRLMPLRVLDSQGFGSSLSVESAIRYAIEQGVQVINISFTGYNYSFRLARALRDAYDAGIVIVAAAGNEGDTERGGDLNEYPAYPICYRGSNEEPITIGVASVGRNDVLSSFSNYGSDCVSIAAPGESFYTTQVYRPEIEGFEDQYGDGWFGSSLAAPVVSGVAALIMSMLPEASPENVRRYLLDHAANIDALNPSLIGQFGTGRIDAAASIRAAQAAWLSGGVVNSEPVVPEEPPEVPAGRLVKSRLSSTVYYLGLDGKRYVFPNEKTFKSWYPHFPEVETLPLSELASYPLAGNITYRPGVRMVKIVTDPKIYAVSKGGVLRHIETEVLAGAIYGPDWNAKIDDVPDVFFLNYRFGPPVTSTLDFSPQSETQRTPTIDHDKNLFSP